MTTAGSPVSTAPPMIGPAEAAWVVATASRRAGTAVRTGRLHNICCAPMAELRDLDVIVVGAGISGIDAAYHLQTSLPGKTFAILEGRDRMGGTWDLFRYPG